MPRIHELRDRREANEDTVIRLADFEKLTPNQDADFRRAAAELDELQKLEGRALRAEEVRRNTFAEIPGVGAFMERRTDGVIGEALRGLERIDGISTRRQVQLEEMVREDPGYAAEFAVHSSDTYRSAWSKLMRYGAADAGVRMTDAERASIAASSEVRAQTEAAQGGGGYAVPVALDGSIILADQESDNPFLRISRVIDVNTNVWKGVSSAGMSWSFDAEGAEVSDDSLTSITQPSVTVYTARGFIPFSIEIGQDWPGFQSEMARIITAGYDELLLSKFTTGNGTSEPYGLKTYLDTTSAVTVTSTTDGQFGQEDVYKTWNALAQKYRRKASWMMSIDVNSRIAQMGVNTQLHAVTTTLGEGQVDRLRTRPVYVNDYLPVVSGTTGVELRLVVGDFSNYVIARRAGLTTELVPVLMSSGSQRPMGMRGWFSWARIGASPVNSSAFRAQYNK